MPSTKTAAELVTLALRAADDIDKYDDGTICAWSAAAGGGEFTTDDLRALAALVDIEAMRQHAAAASRELTLPDRSLLQLARDAGITTFEIG